MSGLKNYEKNLCLKIFINYSKAGKNKHKQVLIFQKQVDFNYPKKCVNESEVFS